MKKSNILRSLLCFLLCAILLITPLSAMAAGQASAGISAKIYNNEYKQIISNTEFRAGQTAYIPISLSSTRTAKGFAFTLEYDKELLEFLPGSSISLITDHADGLSAYTTDAGAIVLWEAGTAIMLSGEVYYAAFRVKDTAESTQTTVTLRVTQLFDTDLDDISVGYTGNQVSIGILLETLSPDELAPFQKLSTITYPDSLADIEAADATFGDFTAAKQQLLQKSHPQVYLYYTTAKNRYNRLVDEAAEQAVLDELAAFADAHKEVLALTPETVQLSNSDAVMAAKKAVENENGAFSKRAEVLLNKTYGDLIDSLLEVIDEQQYINSEIAKYVEAYSNLFELDEKTVQLDLDSYEEMLADAISVYEGKPDAVKNALKAQYDAMVKMKAYCAEQIALRDASDALAKEVSAFQAQWLDVLLLNTATVSEGDETAIRMALAAYGSLSEEAKAQLEPKVKNLESLLLLIEGMKNQSGGNSGGTNGQTQTVVVEKDKLVDKIVYMTKTNPVFLIVLIVLLVLSLASFALPFVLTVYGKKKHKKSPVKEGRK